LRLEEGVVDGTDLRGLNGVEASAMMSDHDRIKNKHVDRKKILSQPP